MPGGRVGHEDAFSRRTTHADDQYTKGSNLYGVLLVHACHSSRFFGLLRLHRTRSLHSTRTYVNGWKSTSLMHRLATPVRDGQVAAHGITETSKEVSCPLILDEQRVYFRTNTPDYILEHPLNHSERPLRSSTTIVQKSQIDHSQLNLGQTIRNRDPRPVHAMM